MKFAYTTLLSALFGSAAVTANHINVQPMNREDAAQASAKTNTARSATGQAKVRSYEVDLKIGGLSLQHIRSGRAVGAADDILQNFNTMTFQLPHSESVTFNLAKTNVAQNHWVGTSTVNGDTTDAYFMVQENGHFAGSLNHEDGSFYSIMTRHDGSTWISFVPAAERIEEEHMHIPEEEDRDDSSGRGQGEIEEDASITPFADDPSNIDVMVVYTKEAMCEAAGVSINLCNANDHSAAIEGQIDLAVANNNVAHTNSNTGTQLTLVHKYLDATYVENGNMSDALAKLRTKSDNQLDSVHDLRDTHKADIVALILANGSGVGYVNAGDSYMFSTTNWSYIPGHTFAHELGHNWGCYHNRASSNTQAAYAHGWQDPGKTFRTILSYPCSGANCPRVNWYSSSDNSIQYNGKNIGDSSNDCSRKIRERRQTVANFREGGSVPAPTPPAPTPTPPACQDDPSFTDSYGDNCSWYSDQSRCDTWGDCCNVGQGTANQKCCQCGGGV